jgi:hypothetical protein
MMGRGHLEEDTIHWLGRPDALLAENPCFAELAASVERRGQLWRESLVGEDAKEVEVRRIEGVTSDASFQHRLGDWRGRSLRPWRGRPRKDSSPVEKDQA